MGGACGAEDASRVFFVHRKLVVAGGTSEVSTGALSKSFDRVLVGAAREGGELKSIDGGVEK